MHRYSTKILGHKCLIIDNETDGVLVIKQKLSEEYLAKLEESDGNPLVDFINDLKEDIAKHKLSLNIQGRNNIITFNDDNLPILEGAITLSDVNIHHPHIVNSSLYNVNIPNVFELSISHSHVTNFEHMAKSPEFFLHYCFINDGYKIDNSAEKSEWLMNNDVTGTMW